jgi:hypothetical protein
MANAAKDGVRRFCRVMLVSTLILVSSLPSCRSLGAAVEPVISSNPQLFLFSLKDVPEAVPGSPFPTISATADSNILNGKDIDETEDQALRNEAMLYYHSSKPVRELWKWKDSVLGDGRDFFVPKPRTLVALQNYILDHCPSLSGQEESECVILSNCARFEIIVVCQTDNNQQLSVPSIATGNHTNDPSFQVKLVEEISRCLLVQMNYYSVKQQERSGWQDIFLFAAANPTMAVDRPQDILTMNAPGVSYYDRDNQIDSSLLLPYWDVWVGAESILPHLCRIAAGMAPRPRRPDRAVLFRPFSSRDAHILLQLKRTRDSCITKQNHVLEKKDGAHSGRQRRRLAVLLEYALRAGKAARNPKIVPELESLRTEYRASTSSSTISAKTLEQSVRVADITYSKAILPLIVEYLQKEHMSLRNVDREIAHFRNTCLAMICSEQEDDRRWMNRRLHGLTLELRNQGRLISYTGVEECYQAIQEELKMFRRAKKLSASDPASG